MNTDFSEPRWELLWGQSDTNLEILTRLFSYESIRHSLCEYKPLQRPRCIKNGTAQIGHRNSSEIMGVYRWGRFAYADNRKSRTRYVETVHFEHLASSLPPLPKHAATYT